MAATNGADVAVAVPAPPVGAPEVEDNGCFKLKFCTVCASNQNRCVTHPGLLRPADVSIPLYLVE